MIHREVERTEGKGILATGAILAGLGVAAGAFGAHLLKAKLGPENLEVWRAATTYQMYHALALLFVGRMLTRHPSRLLRAACWLFILGIVIFAGSLYVLALSGNRAAGAATPVGGGFLLAGWACLAVEMLRSGRS